MKLPDRKSKSTLLGSLARTKLGSFQVSGCVNWISQMAGRPNIMQALSREKYRCMGPG